jgi:alanine racemase
MELVSLQKEMKVASIPIGYSHGYSRSLSNQGRGSHQGTTVYRCWFCKYEHDDC